VPPAKLTAAVVAAVEQPLHRHHDQFGCTVAQIDVIDANAGNILFLRVMHHRLARREHALRVGVAGRAVHVANHVAHDLVRRIEPEHGQVADVELDDLVAVVFHLARLLHRRAPDLVANVVQLV
jgi:hypothetical protein